MALAFTKRSENILEIGSFQAKTCFSELLRTIEQGYSVIITRNGHDIAKMESSNAAAGKTGIAAWNNIMDVAKEIDNGEKITFSQIDEWKTQGRAE